MRRFYIALAALLPLTAFGAPVIYTVKDLGTLGGTGGTGNAINAAGVVAGTAYIADDTAQNAFISGTNGALPLRNLGTLGGAQSFGNGVNSSGMVAGSSDFSSDVYQHAFLSAANGGALMDLGTLGGPSSIASGVNGAAQVSGDSLTTAGPNHVFLSSSGGGVLNDLGTLGGTSSFAGGVNASGQVTGHSNTSSAGITHAFISDSNGGALHDIGTLADASVNSFGVAINDSGQVVGRSLLSTPGVHAFRSEPNGGPLLDLGTLGGFSSYGKGINNPGTAVGQSYLGDNSTLHAFLYTTKFGLMDLNDLVAPGSGWEFTDAKAINDSGQITGAGKISGETHVFLLTPIPPSATITSIKKISGGHILIEGFGTPLETLTVQTTTDLGMGFQTLTTIMAASDGKLSFEDPLAASYTQRFYRFVYP